MLLEICLDNLNSVAIAEQQNIARIELCNGLIEGGTSPSLGLTKQARALFSGEIFAMLRPRAGDFLYSKAEIAAMQTDLAAFANLGVNGVVFGALTSDGKIDQACISQLVQSAKEHQLQTTFHRAFDLCQDLTNSLEILIKLGIDRVLTSGGAANALAGASTIASLVKQGENQIKILVGGGIRPENITAIQKQTNATEFHSSCKQIYTSSMEFRRDDLPLGGGSVPSEYELTQVSPEMIQSLQQALHQSSV